MKNYLFLYLLYSYDYLFFKDYYLNIINRDYEHYFFYFINILILFNFFLNGIYY